MALANAIHTSFCLVSDLLNASLNALGFLILGGNVLTKALTNSLVDIFDNLSDDAFSAENTSNIIFLISWSFAFEYVELA